VGFDKDVHWLNGICSHDGWFERRILGFPVLRYNFRYTESQSSWRSNADNLLKSSKDILISWFEKCSDIGLLKEDPNSPLDNDQQAVFANS
jgi:hypothetical protein